MHLFLEHFDEILDEYPDAHLYTIGKNPRCTSLSQRFRQDSYNRYLGRIIKKHGLEEKVTFLDALDEGEMCKRFLSSNVFISCSSIENSCNSLAEAMMLGVPCITSDVGGIRSFFTDKSDGFMFPADEPYMIPYYIKQIIDSKTLCEAFSKNSSAHASNTHNVVDVIRQYKTAYSAILNN